MTRSRTRAQAAYRADYAREINHRHASDIPVFRAVVKEWLVLRSQSLVGKQIKSTSTKRVLIKKSNITRYAWYQYRTKMPSRKAIRLICDAGVLNQRAMSDVTILGFIPVESAWGLRNAFTHIHPIPSPFSLP